MELVKRNELILASRRCARVQKNNGQKLRPAKTHLFPLVAHAYWIYSTNAIDIFENEINLSVSYNAIAFGDDSFIVWYHTKEDDGRFVNHYSDGDSRTSIAVTCECNKFQIVGLLCRYKNRVLVQDNITSIPDAYIKDCRCWGASSLGDNTTALGSTGPASLFPACQSVRMHV